MKSLVRSNKKQVHPEPQHSPSSTLAVTEISQLDHISSATGEVGNGNDSDQLNHKSNASSAEVEPDLSMRDRWLKRFHLEWDVELSRRDNWMRRFRMLLWVSSLVASFYCGFVVPLMCIYEVPFVSEEGKLIYVSDTPEMPLETAEIKGKSNWENTFKTILWKDGICVPNFEWCNHATRMVEVPSHCLDAGSGIAGMLASSKGVLDATKLITDIEKQGFLAVKGMDMSRMQQMTQSTCKDPHTNAVVAEVLVSGDVSDFTTAVRNKLVENVAERAGTIASKVELTVSAASVRLRFQITGLLDAEATVAAEGLAKVFNNTKKASEFLSAAAQDISVSVLSIEAAAGISEPPAPPPAAPSPPPVDYSGRRLWDEDDQRMQHAEMRRPRKDLLRNPRRSWIGALASLIASAVPWATPALTVDLVVARFDENITWLRTIEEELPEVQIWVYDKSSNGPSSDACTDAGLVRAMCIPTPNVGLESNTYLKHITSRWDRLADKTVFAQGQEPSPGFYGHRKGGGHMMPLDDFLYDYVRPSAPPRFVPTAARLDRGNSVPALISFRTAITDPMNGGEESLLAEAWPDATPLCPLSAASWSAPVENLWDVDYLEREAERQHAELGLGNFWEAQLSHILGPFPSLKVSLYSAGAVFSVSREQIHSQPAALYWELLAGTSTDRDAVASYYLEMVWGNIFGFKRELNDCMTTLSGVIGGDGVDLPKGVEMSKVQTSQGRKLSEAFGNVHTAAWKRHHSLESRSTSVGYGKLCGSDMTPPPSPPPSPPCNDAKVKTMLDLMDDMSNFAAGFIKDSARTSGGCRVDKMLGEAIPTFLGAWQAILFVLFVQSLANFQILISRIKNRVRDAFNRHKEDFFKRTGLIKYVEKYRKYRDKYYKYRDELRNARAKAASLKAKAIGLKKDVKNTKEVEAYVEDVEEDGAAAGKTKSGDAEKGDAEKGDIALGVAAGEDGRDGGDGEPDVDLAAFIKHKLKAQCGQYLNTSKEYSAMIKVFNLTVTIFTFLIAVVAPTAWSPVLLSGIPDISSMDTGGPNATKSSIQGTEHEEFVGDANLLKCVGAYIWDGSSQVRIGVGTAYSGQEAGIPPPAVPAAPPSPPLSSTSITSWLSSSVAWR